MLTYINKDIIGNYFDSEVAIETIDGYQESVGDNWEDFLNGKFILLNDEQLQFRVDNPDASVKEVFDMEIETVEIPEEPVYERTIEDAKNEMIGTIEDYDLSDEVNIFYIGDDELWLDKATRSGLILRFNAEMNLGIENTTVWYGTTSYIFPVSMAIQMLYMVERYASECYDNTQSHIAQVSEMEDINEIDSFDYRAGYPEKLHF